MTKRGKTADMSEIQVASATSRTHVRLPNLADFENGIILHENMRATIAAVQHYVVQRSEPSASGEKAKANVFSIVGGSGSGKSTILDVLERGWTNGPPPGWNSDTDFRPVIRAEVPRNLGGVKQFVSAIMDRLGYPVGRLDAGKISTRIAHLCKEMGVQVLMIDEAHHLVNPGNRKTEADMSEFVKSLLNQLPCQVVMAGLPRLLRLKLYNQTRRRFDEHAHLRPYGWRTEEGRDEFKATLVMLYENLKVDVDLDPLDEDEAARIYCATGGHVGLVSKYLSKALFLVRTGAYERFDLNLLAHVHDRFAARLEDADLDDIGEYGAQAMALPKVVDRANPFRPEADMHTLWNLMRERRLEDYEGVPPDLLKGTRTLGSEVVSRVLGTSQEKHF